MSCLLFQFMAIWNRRLYQMIENMYRENFNELRHISDQISSICIFPLWGSCYIHEQIVSCSVFDSYMKINNWASMCAIYLTPTVQGAEFAEISSLSTRIDEVLVVSNERSNARCPHSLDCSLSAVLCDLWNHIHTRIPARREIINKLRLSVHAKLQDEYFFKSGWIH